MKKIKPVFLLLLMFPSLLLSQNNESQNVEARTMVEQAFARSDIYGASDIKDFILNLNMQKFYEGAQKENNSLRIKVLKEDSLTKIMVRYTDPASVRGTTYLGHIRLEPQKSEGIWLYLPSFDKTKRITANKFRKSVPLVDMGLALINSNEFDFDGYNYAFRNEGENASASANVSIELRPKSKRASDYKLIELESDKALIKRIITMNSKEEVIEEVLFSDYRQYGNYYLPGLVNRRGVLKKQQQQVTISGFKLNQGFLAQDFEPALIKAEF